MRKRLLIALLIALLLAPIGLAAFLLYTETGVQLIAGPISRLERIGITIEGVSGTLAGRLRVKRFELKHPRVHVLVHDIEITPQLRGLLIQTLQARSVIARDALIETHAAHLPPNNRPLRFLPRFMRVDARSVDLHRVRYVHMNGASIEARRLRGRVTITSGRLRVRTFNVEADQFGATGQLELYAARPLGLSGAAEGHLRMPHAQATLRAQAHGSIDRLQIGAEIEQPSQIRVQALFTRPQDRWKLEGEVKAAALALDALMAKPPFALRNVDLNVAATQEGVHVAGNVGVPELSERDLTLHAQGRFSNRVLQIAAADLQLKDAPGRVHASGSVAFEGDTPKIDASARWSSLQWPLIGDPIVTSPSGAATLRGSPPYELTVDAAIEGPRIPHAQGEAAGLISKEQLTITSYKLDALEGEISGAGVLQFARPRAWALSAKASEVNPAGIHAQFPGRVNFLAAAEGSGLDARANYKLALKQLEGTLRGELIRAAGSVERNGKAWIARAVDVRFGSARLALEGALADAIQASWSLHAPSLADILPEAAGSLDFSGHANGSRTSPRIVAEIKGEGLRYGSWMAARLALMADLDATNANPSRLSLDAAQLGRGEPIISELRVKGAGAASDHRIELDVAGFAPNPRQTRPRATLKALGAYEKGQWRGTLAALELSRGAGEERTLKSVESARIAASAEEAILEGLCLAISAGRVCAEGKWKREGAWEAMVAGYEIPLAFVLPPSGAEAEYAGRIEGRIRAHGSPGQPWLADAGMRIIDAAVIYRPPGSPPQTLNLGTGGLAATATPERIDFSFGVQAFTDTFLYASAELLRNGSNDLMQLPLTGEIRARAADANVLPLVFPEIDHAAGLVTANARVSGSLSAPEINGRIELAHGEFDSYRVNLALRELSLIADLANTALEFRGSGRAGDGQVALEGRFAWQDNKTHGDFHLLGRNLLVADLPEYRVVASPDLRFLIDDQQIDVAGDVTIPAALIQPNELTGAVRVSDDARYVGEHPAERAGRFVVRSEVHINMGDDVRIDAFGLHGRITGSVGTTIHTGETPVGRGELGVKEGRYEAYGQELEISRGRLLFDAAPLDDPSLDIEARRKIDATTVGLNVRGTLQAPRLSLFSDPPMVQTQIVSYLVTGKSVETSESIDSMHAGDSAAIRSVQDTLALQGGGLLASQIGRRFGLEEVGVESSVDPAGETNTSLVLGKFLSPRLFISYGISLTESINTLKLRYTMSDRWIFKTEAGERQSADVEFTVER
ncbi:MAG TPA: translocation/assembly module TamB domain-containing protein [Steroidobacter sp.]|nr:translocation/assembly module TamB domain-containing protein [Steroidobacter sp.]